MSFPTISGRDLFGDRVILPEQLKGTYNLLLIAYEPWQWVQVERWRPFAYRLSADYAAFDFFEIALAGTHGNNDNKGWPFQDQSAQTGRYLIDPLPDHNRILLMDTLRTKFNTQIGVSHDRQIVSLLVENGGKILWQERGQWTPEKAESLDEFLLNNTPLIEDFK